MEEFIAKTRPISEDEPVVATIHDEIEGNVDYTFKVIFNDFNSSYTKYNVVDEHHAEIIISNPSGFGVKPDKPILVGTYRNTYNLYVSFVLFSEGGKWFLEHTFYIATKKDGSNKK